MKAQKKVKAAPARKKQLGEVRNADQGITAIEVEGFKSLAKRTRVEIRPLTILAGANSSGKSSLMQGLLLLKQTLDASYDPGPLLLHNSHVKFTSVDQLLSKVPGRRSRRTFRFGLEVSPGEVRVAVSFRRLSANEIELEGMELQSQGTTLSLDPQMTGEELGEAVESFLSTVPFRLASIYDPFRSPSLHGPPSLAVRRDRCFLWPVRTWPGSAVESRIDELDFSGPTLRLLRSILHLPGLRGNPERAYPVAAVEATFAGTFDIYTASVILSWQKHKDLRLGKLDRMAEQLGLTWKVQARQLDATRVEVLVGRLARKGKDENDLVNIADVGFGVSQVLPVVVALLQAQPGQLVYIEQPELHLHPRAQTVMASLLAEAANRGVRVVAETHSSLLLLSLQTLVAQGKIKPEDVILHWFERGADGATKVTSADLDRQGTFGDWPENFGEVSLDAHQSYFEAAEAKLRSK